MTLYFDTTTPQLKLIDQLFEAYRNCDLSSGAPLLSKDFKHKFFPKAANLPDQTKEEHLGSHGLMLAKLGKMDHIIYDVVDAPGKVVVQWTAVWAPHDGPTFEYECVTIYTIVEEDGELKVLEAKEFANTEKRSNTFKILSWEGQAA